MASYGRKQPQVKPKTAPDWSMELTQKKIEELKALMQKHSVEVESHRGNVVNYEIHSFPFTKTAKCSYCGTNLEVRMDAK